MPTTSTTSSKVTVAATVSPAFKVPSAAPEPAKAMLAKETAAGAVASITRFDEMALLVLPAASVAVMTTELDPFKSRLNTPELIDADAKSMLQAPDCASTL